MPTVAETVPGYDYSGWAGLLAPKATPKPIIDRLQAALAAAAASAALKEGFAAQGAEVVVTSPEEFRRFLEQDIASTARVVKAAGTPAGVKWSRRAAPVTASAGAGRARRAASRRTG